MALARDGVLARSGADAAQSLALQGLALVVGDEQLLGHFLDVTGCDGDDLRQSAGDPQFLGAVMDFILMDDQTVLALAEAAGVDPTEISRSRRHLPGAAME